VRNPNAVPRKIPTLNPVRYPRSLGGPNPNQTLNPAKPPQKPKPRFSLRPKIPTNTISLESQLKNHLPPGTVLLNRNRRIHPENPTIPPTIPPLSKPISSPPTNPTEPIKPYQDQIISSIQSLIEPVQGIPKHNIPNQPKILAAYELYTDSVPNETIFMWELAKFEGKKISNIRIKTLEDDVLGGIGQRTGACAYRGEVRGCRYRVVFYA
jgi:hypothetical protein